MADKLVVIINGAGGVGKDTMIDYVAGKIGAVNHSTITTVKEIAKIIGWNGKKDIPGRLFLHRTKMMLSEWFDFPYKEMLSAIESFMESGEVPVMFCQVREEPEIRRLCKELDAKGIPHTTVLVTRESVGNSFYGNPADDGVGKTFDYNYWLENDGSIEESGEWLLNRLNYELSVH